jgi:hypothetical protein
LGPPLFPPHLTVPVDAICLVSPLVVVVVLGMSVLGIVPHRCHRPCHFVVVPIVVVVPIISWLSPLFHGCPRCFVVIPVILWSSPSSWFANLRPVIVILVPLPFHNSCFHPTSGGSRGASNMVVVHWKHPRSTLRAEARRAGADACSSIIICVVLDAMACNY